MIDYSLQSYVASKIPHNTTNDTHFKKKIRTTYIVGSFAVTTTSCMHDVLYKLVNVYG